MKRPAEVTTGFAGLVAALGALFGFGEPVLAAIIAGVALLPGIVTGAIERGWLPKHGPFYKRNGGS